ncbi:MAG: cupin domain-containing protein [Alphaproteobacteria bacterium]|nr:cupin domain-containing protein [Alphaproteobacteria bacterium]
MLLGLALGAASTELLHAQQGGIKRTMLQKGDTVDIPGHEVVMGISEVTPGAAAGRHTHPGTEIGYVIEGSGTLLVDGQAPREVKPGDSWIIDAGKVHDAKAGPNGVKVVGVFVVEKGKPLATPAP